MSEPRTHVLVTRPRMAAARLVEALDGIRAVVLVSPILEFRALPFDPPSLDALLIVTSAYGVEAARGGMDLTDRRAVCVGEATARALKDAGAEVAWFAATAADLTARLLSESLPARVAHLRGAHAVSVTESLNSPAIETDNIVCYTQDPRPLSPEAVAVLGSGQPVVLPVFSPRSAALLADQIVAAESLHLVAISTAAAAPLRELTGTCTIADTPDLASMVAAIRRTVSAL